MAKVSLAILLLTALAAEVLCDLPVIYPTYQTTRETPKTRSAREVTEQDEFNLGYQEHFTDLPVNKYVRVVRSLDSPSAKRGGGSHTTSSSSRNTGSTHPGYNRRNSRDINDEPLWLYKGDDVIRAPPSGEHPKIPTYIDDIRFDPNRRYARSLSGDFYDPSRPWKPHFPSPTFPKPVNPFFPDRKMPIYVRNRRDFQYPKWNPHVPSGPWIKIPVRKH